MITCPRCLRDFPEVVGVADQACPHCAHEFALPASSALPAPVAHVDPVAAIQAAVAVSRRLYPRFLLLWLPALLLELAVAFADPLYRSARGLPEGALTTGETLELLGLQVPLLLVTYVVRLALWTFLAALTMDALLGRARATRWRALLVPSVALAVVLVLLYAVGGLLVIVGFFVFLHWFLYAPAMLAEGAGGVGAALEASRAFARERRTYGFTALVVLLGMLAFGASYLLERAPGVWGLVMPALFSWSVGPVVPMLAASFVAVSRRVTPDLAPAAPAPASPAASATTACPKCATLIPYTSTGSAVDVVCPSCGHAGRVL